LQPKNIAAKSSLPPKNIAAKNSKSIELEGFKILDKIDTLIDKTYFTLRASKIQKYPKEIQELCNNKISNLIMYLQNELKIINKERKIIEI